MTGQTTRVRDAVDDDVDGLTALLAQVQSLHAAERPDLFRPADHVSLRSFWRERLRDESMILVAEHGGTDLVGYLLAELMQRPESAFQLPHTAVYVHHIAVDDTARRSGVGRALMAAISERARDAGAAFLRLDSWSFNMEAHRFFDAEGFTTSRLVFERALQPASPTD
jgi:ribosomal protein S18 acetylase RimI-like enzyme